MDIFTKKVKCLVLCHEKEVVKMLLAWIEHIYLSEEATEWYDMIIIRKCTRVNILCSVKICLKLTIISDVKYICIQNSFLLCNGNFSTCWTDTENVLILKNGSHNSTPFSFWLIWQISSCRFIILTKATAKDPHYARVVQHVYKSVEVPVFVFNSYRYQIVSSIRRNQAFCALLFCFPTLGLRRKI